MTQNGVYYKIGKYSCIQGNIGTEGQYNLVHAHISMCDYYYGNIYIIFYDNASSKEQYMDPVVVDFTNAPTIVSSTINKYDDTTKDNVFNTKWKPSDGARVDVLTGTTTENDEYYNEYQSSNRLYTNGFGTRNDDKSRKDGHPLYVNWLYTFVPKEISDLYAATSEPIGFQITAAYLTTDSSTTATKLPLEFAEKKSTEGGTGTANKNYTTQAVVDKADSTITGNYQEFVISLSNKLCPNATDADFRSHCKYGYDLVLTGISNDWK